MTISSTNRKSGPFLGTGLVSEYPFNFVVFDDADLVVVRADDNGVEATLALGFGYTVSLNEDQDSSPGGEVVLAAPLPSGHKLVITSDIEALQPTDLTNQGGFYPQVITRSLDRLTIIAQQLKEQVGRAVITPISSSQSGQQYLDTLVDAIGDQAANAATTQVQANLAWLDTRVDVAEEQIRNVAGSFNPRGLWATATAYSAGTVGSTTDRRDVVLGPDGEGYVVLVSHVSGVFADDVTAGRLLNTDAAQLAVDLATAGEVKGAGMVQFLPAGSGAVARSMQSKGRESVSVLDFGADPTGTVSSSTAFQAAVTHVNSLGGGGVSIPDGTYLLSKGVAVSGSRCKIYAPGFALIRKTASINAFNVSGSDNEIRGLRIDGQLNGGNGILVTGSNNTIWFNEVYDNFGVGIGQNGRLTTCQGNTIIFNKVDNITGNTGISTNAASYGMVGFNRISNVQKEGLANNQPYRCMYIGNMVTSSSSGGVAGIGTDAADQTIWAMNMSYGNNRGFKAKEHNGGSDKDILAFNLFANNTNEGVELENNTSPSGQNGTYVISSNVATVTVSAGHMLSASDTARIVFSEAATDGNYVVASIVSPTVFTAPVVSADESGTCTVGFIDPLGNYGREWTMVGNITTGNGADNFAIDAKDVSGPDQKHILLANITPETQQTLYGPSSRVASRPVAFEVRKSASQDNVTGNGTIASLTWGTVLENVGAAFNAGTGKVTAPYPGRYTFSLAVRMLETTGATLGAVRIEVDDGSGGAAERVYEAPLTVSVSAEMRGFVTCTVFLDKGWVVTPKVRITGLAGDTADVSADATTTWFSGAAL